LAPLRRGRAGVRKLPPPCIPRLRSGGHAFAGRKPLPSPKGEAWGRTPPPRPLPLSSCNSQLRTLTRAGEGGRGFASSPRPASPRLRSGDHAYAGETPSRPLKGKPGGVPPPPRPLHLSPLRSPQGGTGGQAAPCNPCDLPLPSPKGEAGGLPAPYDPYARPSRRRRFRVPLLRSACPGRQTRKAVHPQQPAGVRSPH
jgi:hypothetical protein